MKHLSQPSHLAVALWEFSKNEHFLFKTFESGV